MLKREIFLKSARKGRFGAEKNMALKFLFVQHCLLQHHAVSCFVGPREWRTGSYLTVEGTPPSQSKPTSSNDSLSHNAQQSRPMPSVALFMGILPFYDKAKLMRLVLLYQEYSIFPQIVSSLFLGIISTN